MPKSNTSWNHQNSKKHKENEKLKDYLIRNGYYNREIKTQKYNMGSLILLESERMVCLIHYLKAFVKHYLWKHTNLNMKTWEHETFFKTLTIL